MNEAQKTGLFAALAIGTIVLAFVTRPVTVTKQDEKGGVTAGDLLFKEEAADFSKAASLKITKFDENRLSMDSFEVVKDKTSGLWKIPSEYDYPADAEEQLRNATSPLGELRVLNIIEDAGRDDHSLYGVVEPNEKLEAGVTGVGMLVSVADASGKSMASLIVGKQADKNQEKLHYVRIPNQDPVYTVELDTTAFNTDFKKWIKPDLLQVKSFDITGVGIRDYQIERTQTGGQLGARMSQSMEADLSYDTTTSKWQIDRLVNFKDGQPVPVELGENEELKSDKLNSLRTAAQSLQIVGVRPKPKGLAADLKADKSLLESDESMISLFEQGFIPQTRGDTTEIYAVAGETLLTTQDGVRYVLRFGEERIANSALEATDEENSGDEDKAADAGAKRERYLLVTAALDDSKFPTPELQAVPETIEDLKKLDAEKAAAEEAKKEAAADAANAEDKPSDEAAPSDEAKPADDDKPADDKPADDKPADDKPADDKPADAQPENAKPEDASTEEPKSDEPKSDESGEAASDENSCEPGDAQATDAVADAQQAAGQADNNAAQPDADEPDADKPDADKPDADKSDADKPDADKSDADKPAETEEELKDRLSVVQSDITKSNQRLLDARNEKINAARKKVQELNARFADWYYLIDDASFKQLMLKQDVLIGPKAAASASPSPGAPGAANFPGLPTPPSNP